MSKNYLFLIAIDGYKKIAKLRNCVKDAERIKTVLHDRFSFESDNTTTLYNEEAKNKRVQEELERYVKQLSNDDNLIIYFSGHGLYKKEIDKAYWAPYDADNDDISTFFSNVDLLDYIEKIKAKHIVIFSDCCFSRKILLTNAIKGIESLYDSPSRWAITTGEGVVHDNGFFSEVIESYLKKADKDILISELINHIKFEYATNLFQTPQGTPLLDPNHKGGEFIFKISEMDDNDTREFRGYNDILDVLTIYRPNSKFIEMPKCEIREDGKPKIGYILYQEIDDVIQKGIKAVNYLFLYEGINLRETRKHVFDNHIDKLKDRMLVVLLPKERNQIRLDARKKNVEKLFNPNGVFYIDDFILQHCTPKHFFNTKQEKYLENPYFILPTLSKVPHEYNETHEIVNIEYIRNWFDARNEPILILKGSGGIGKTTMARYISDVLQREAESMRILFIESHKVVDELINIERQGKKLDFYNFYKSQVDRDSSGNQEQLNNKSFHLNFDAGNLFIVIDGLDEIITRIPNFDVQEFILSIKSHTSEIGNGKVIITCRTYFWHTINSIAASEIRSLDIHPFSQDQASRFFRTCFRDDLKAIKRGLEIAEEFAFPDEQETGANYYHPYALDIIRTIVDTPALLTANLSSETKILDKRVKLDYIIYSICDREIERVKQLNIDEQIKFLVYLATTRRGVIKKDNFKHELESVLGKRIDNVSVEALKAHTLLTSFNSSFKLKYDFLFEYFNCIYVSNYMQINEFSDFKPELAEVLSENCWFDSSLVKDVRNRAQEWTEDNLLKVSDLISQIINWETPRVDNKRKAIAGLFYLALSINHKFKSNDKRANTELLKHIFGLNNEINGLHIINFSSNEGYILFDFCDLTFKDCYIDSFSDFWKNDFNKNTFFIDCSLFNLGFEELKEIPIPRANFINPKTDKTLDTLYAAVEIKERELLEQAKDFLREVLGTFFSYGRLQAHTIEDAQKGRERFYTLKKGFLRVTNKLFNFHETIDFLKNEGLIVIAREHNEDKARITDDAKVEVTKFCHDRTISMRLLRIAQKIAEEIK